MSIVTPPRAGIVLGFAKVNGQDVPVTISDEYLRWFAGLMDRIGGVKSIDLDELAAILVSPVTPHPQDPQHAPAMSMDEVVARAEDAARQQVQALIPEEQVGDAMPLIAALREELSAVKPKRVIQDFISFTTGSATKVISPAITGMAELQLLGVSTNAATFAEASVAISLTGSTVTADRGAAGASVTVWFQITEWP